MEIPTRRSSFDGGRWWFQDPLLQRADSALSFYNDFASIAIGEIFVSEYQTEKGRVHESLWVFSEDYIGEALLVGDKERLDLVPRRNNVARLDMQRDEFNFDGTATDASRLTVHFTVGSGSSGIGGALRASGSNCLQLEEVLRRFLIPALG